MNRSNTKTYGKFHLDQHVLINSMTRLMHLCCPRGCEIDSGTMEYTSPKNEAPTMMQIDVVLWYTMIFTHFYTWYIKVLRCINHVLESFQSKYMIEGNDTFGTIWNAFTQGKSIDVRRATSVDLNHLLSIDIQSCASIDTQSHRWNRKLKDFISQKIYYLQLKSLAAC